MSAKLLRRCVALLALCLPASVLALPFSNIYVIGDSLSDQGNLLRATSLIQAQTPQVPQLPDPRHYAAGRFSNGPVYTDYLSASLGIPLAPSLFGGNNFACKLKILHLSTTPTDVIEK